MPRPFSFLLSALAAMISMVFVASARTLDDAKQRHATLTSETITLNGHSELHLSGGGDPIPGCVIHLNSGEAWVFFHRVVPSAVVSNLLSRIRVNGTPAVADGNVRVAQYVNGSVVIPQPSGFQPLEVFSGRHFSGVSTGLDSHTPYNSNTLGGFAGNIRSFRLKRGYTATFASNTNGTGTSRNFVAQDSDLELSVMPGGLDGTVRFVRVFPWRWVSKKGSCDVDPGSLQARWHYNWSINANSTRDREYVAIKQQPNWPSLDQNWRTRGVNHLLGYNEPDNPVEDSYKNLTPQGSISNAVARWPELLGTGLRVGAPAVTDAGTNWIVNFMNQANAAGHRVDYVPVHYYRSHHNNNDPAGAANQMYHFLKSIHDAVGRPIWVTEFNNGANWTNNAHDPTAAQNRNVIQAMIRMMDDTPWIERYAIYSRVEWFRQTHYDDGSITPMGQMYRDHLSPMAYVQTIPNTGSSGNAHYPFEGHLRDIESGNNPLKYGTPNLVPGRNGSALAFDGVNDHLALPGRLGDSSNFSFAAWVRWNGGGNWQRIFDLGNGTSRYLYLTPRSADNTMRFGIRIGGTQQTLNSAALTPGEWTHVAVTMSGNTGKLFVNGSLAATNTGMTLQPQQVDTETNFLGKSQWSSDPMFSGLLDDVRFFNTGLSDAQVAELAGSAAPEFVETPALPVAAVGQPYAAGLAPLLHGNADGVVFSKISGPAWIAVATDGTLGGVPEFGEAGRIPLRVRATSGDGWTFAEADVALTVAVGDPLTRLAFEGRPAATAGHAAATLVGGAGYGPGRSGQALSLDGGGAHAVLPAGVAGADEVTVAAWVFWNGGAPWQRVFDFGNGTGSYLFMTPRSAANTLRFGIRNGGAEEILESTQLATSTWTHLAVTLGGGVGKLYVNGTLVDEMTAMTLRPSDIRPATNFIGRSQWTSDPNFSGRIDGFHVFHRALDAAEVIALHTGTMPAISNDSLVLPGASPGEPFIASVATNASAPVGVIFSKVSGPAWLAVEADGRISGKPGPGESGHAPFRLRAASAVSPVLAADFEVRIPVAPPPGLRAHHEFDGNAEDSAGRHDATAHGSPVHVAGWFDGAAIFDGTDDHFELPAVAVADLTEVTLAARFRWDGGSAWQRVFDFGNNTTEYLMLTPSSGAGTLRFSITTGGTATQQILEAAPPRIGEWTHVAVTLDGTIGTLYVNGSAAASGPITLTPADIAPTLNYLGKSQWPDPLLRGAIDDFRIIDRALDAAQVRTLAVPAPAEIVPPAMVYDLWASAIGFPAGSAGPADDADGDGLANVIEWLFGSDPLDPSSGAVPPAERLGAAEVGLNAGKTHLAMRARLRKDRPGVTLIPEAAASLGGLGVPEAAARVQQAGPSVDDGEFEIITWFSETAIEDAPAGFMRLRVRVD